MSTDLHLGAISQEMASGSDPATMGILIREFGHRQRRRVMGPDDPCPACFPEAAARAMTRWVTGKGWQPESGTTAPDEQ